MDASPYSGLIADPAKCRLLSVDAKRKFVRELSKCPDRALVLLHELKRRDIIQIFCSELCKNRKYEGVSKKRILHYLFRAVNEKSCGHGKSMKKSGPEPNSTDIQLPYKRQKKIIVQALPAIGSAPVTAGIRAPTNNAHLCKNSACRASLVPADKFCKRCSCCICFKYDDNKDPSLWLSCNSDQLLQEESCGFSCHLECAFRDERAGILQDGQSKKLDGGYYCTHCGKQNDLLGCWKKQLLIAKDARRLDVLCHRIFLSHKILISTQKYVVLHEIVDAALKKLEGELGPITGHPDNGRGIVGPLAVGAKVQKLCTRAIETLESMLNGTLTADPPIQRLIADPAKFRLLSVDAKREFVCELSKCPDRALELLHGWTRRDMIQIFCSELCKKRKYEEISKQRILNYLFNAVNEKSCGHGKSMKKSGPEPNSSDMQLPYKRLKTIVVQALPDIANAPVTAGISAPTNKAHLCENSACRAGLVPADKFCKHCSCCICFKYDGNKDPSLWLSCNSDQLWQEESCGFSCHLECVFRDERSGILQSKKLDGGYYCTHCGKQNDLLGCWKKQLLVAKDARQLDVLCHRIFLSHKILISTQKYLVLHEIVDTALKKLEGELGPITGLPAKGRGIVARLAVGTEVQRLCTRAIETLESMLNGALIAESQIQRLIADPAKCRLLSVDAKREFVCELSKSPDKALELLLHEWTTCGIIQIFCSQLCKDGKYVGMSKQQILNYLFNAVNEKSCGHGKSMKKSAPEPNSSEIQLPYKTLKKIVVPALPVIASAPGCLSGKSTPGRIEDGGHKDGPSEPSTSDQVTSLPKSLNLVPHKQGILLEKAPGSLAPRTGNGIELGDSIIGTGSRSSNDDHVPHPGPLKPRIEPWIPSSSNPSGKPDDIEQTDENAYLLCVKVIRQLECEGHVDIHFRVKFLTWLSLRATLREKEIVSVFVDTFTDDLTSLASQLRDTFSEAICSKKPPMAP